MSSPPPTKPPRGVKQGKETSGLLMSVIRTLSASETNEQREKERAKLEKEYKKSDARLDELVAEHATEIMEVMQKFSAVVQALSSWNQHCDAVTGRLTACRGLLQLRRDDLKRLWMTARTHHYALQMLTDIERVVVSERSAREYVASGRVLACAHTLTEALETATTTLNHVDALNATRQHLDAKKRELVDVILARISEAVYRADRAPLTRALSARRRTALLLAELTKSEEVTDAYLQDITPEFEASLTEEDKTFETTVMISLEALGVLEQLKEATEKFKVSIQHELLEVIDSVSRRIIEEGDDVEMDPESDEDGEIQDTTGMTETGRPLAKLVTILADEFRACASRNKRLLQLWRAALQKHRLSDSCLHTEQHYWSAVQQVLQLLLTEYLEIESVNLAATRAPGAAPFADQLRIADYFGKKRPQRRRTELFKLTSAPTSRTSVATRRNKHPLVCRADPAHLHAVLPALHALCADIEPLTGGECSLRAFITDYVRTGESERLSLSARTTIDETLRAHNAWRERGPPPQSLVNDTRHRVIFSHCGVAWQAIEHVVSAAKLCGACGGAWALRGATHAIAALAATARAAHSKIAYAPTEHVVSAAKLCGACGGAWALRGATHAIAALAATARAAHSKIAYAPTARALRWLSDDDIVRFLQALPNWRAATQKDAHNIPKDELKQAYEREAEILGSSLGDGAVTRKEIIHDVNTLLDVAVLCETMDWLATNIRSIPSKVAGSGPGGGVKVTDKFIADVNSAAMIFDEISHKCLLLLHLEMRIECFHYLGQEDSISDDADADSGGAGKLAHALLAFHEQANNVLAQRRLNYIMEGIGEMMSAAVIWRWRGWRGAAGSGAGGAAWLAALRHAAAALHVPHDSLHRATHYLQLLTRTHQEIIQQVREKGPQFSELEYLNAFKVIGAKRNMSDADMKQALKQLSAALGHVGVTV